MNYTSLLAFLSRLWRGGLGSQQYRLSIGLGIGQLPWGTPASMGWMEDKVLCVDTWNKLTVSYDLRMG
jgi:hypothetical protein